MSIILYDLACSNNRRPSPFCWRVKYALAHKGLEFTTVPLKFTDIEPQFNGRYKTVPTINDNGYLINGSDHIVNYLNKAYPQNPLLVEDLGKSQLSFLDDSQPNTILGNLFGIYALDIFKILHPEDRMYFRASREQELDCTLENFVINRDLALQSLRQDLNPLRKRLSTSQFLSGITPNYTDYIAISAVLWILSVSTLPLLEPNDRLINWIARCQDLYKGLGYTSTLNNLSNTKSDNQYSQ